MASKKRTKTNGIVNGVIMTEDNTDKVLADLRSSIDRALTIIGIKVEKYAKARCPVGTPESTGIKGYRGGTLRNSITFSIDDSTLTVGSNVEYAPYVELGTGPFFQAPPQWEQFDVPPASGIGGGYVRSRPYLRPAIEDHINEFENIVKKELGS